VLLYDIQTGKKYWTNKTVYYINCIYEFAGGTDKCHIYFLSSMVYDSIVVDCSVEESGSRPRFGEKWTAEENGICFLGGKNGHGHFTIVVMVLITVVVIRNLTLKSRLMFRPRSYRSQRYLKSSKSFP